MNQHAGDLTVILIYLIRAYAYITNLLLYPKNPLDLASSLGPIKLPSMKSKIASNKIIKSIFCVWN